MNPQQLIYKATILADRKDLAGAEGALRLAIGEATEQADRISFIQASVILAELLIADERAAAADALISNALVKSQDMSSDESSAVAYELSRLPTLRVLVSWPFEEPRNVAVFTTQQVLSSKDPILHVAHDEEDGAWQFHGASPSRLSDALIVALSEVVEHDVSIAELADLPLGWVAERAAPGKPWKRKRDVAAV